jgi:hypothetical protein
MLEVVELFCFFPDRLRHVCATGNEEEVCVCV